MKDESQSSSLFNLFNYEDPPTSEAEWQAKSAEWESQWEEFIRLAREYGWPKDYIEMYLQGHRVTGSRTGNA